MIFSELADAVRNEISIILRNGDGCHDFDHTLRVWKNALFLAEQEQCSPIEKQAIELAALLHDCARPEEFLSGGKVCHAEIGAGKSAAILRKLGCEDSELIDIVSNAVKRHRFRGKECPVTLVDRILYDADKLDSIGAIGVGRAFYYAGKLGARLHNTAEEALHSEAYSKEDTAYREYLVKLRHVPERMTTNSGKTAALSRAAFMEGFFQQIHQEIKHGTDGASGIYGTNSENMVP